MHEYCCRYRCHLHGKCEDEIITDCVGCEFLYDCEFCVYEDECEKEEECLFEKGR